MRLIALTLLMTVVGCAPELLDGGYFCGPERLCPEGQTCDDSTFICGSANTALPFACPEGSVDSTHDFGATDCGQPDFVRAKGCIEDGTDIDTLSFTYAESCGDVFLDFTVDFPAAFVPLAAELHDAGGAVVATGTLCSAPLEFSGMDKLCFAVDAPTVGATYSLVITPDGPDCGGDCRFNHYVLDIDVTAN